MFRLSYSQNVFLDENKPLGHVCAKWSDLESRPEFRDFHCQQGLKETIAFTVQLEAVIISMCNFSQ